MKIPRRNNSAYFFTRLNVKNVIAYFSREVSRSADKTYKAISISVFTVLLHEVRLTAETKAFFSPKGLDK